MSDYFRPSHKDSAGQTPPFEWCEDKRKEGEICHASLPPIVARVRDQSNQSSVDPWSTPDRHASIPERRRRRCRRTDAPPRTDQGAGLLVGVARLRDRGVDWGTVIASMKVGQARFPGSLRHAYETQTLEENRSPPAALRLLLRRYVAGRRDAPSASTEPGFLTGRYCDCCASCWEGASSKGCTSTQPSPSKSN